MGSDGYPSATHHISRVGLLAHIGTLVYNVLSSYPTTNKQRKCFINIQCTVYKGKCVADICAV